MAVKTPLCLYDGVIKELQAGDTLASSGGPPTDPYWNNVVLAMHCNGTNGSTTFTDEKGKTVTAYGNAQISTAQSMFNGSSGLLDGAGDYLVVPDSADWAFGTSDFTLEAFFRAESLSGVHALFDQWTAGSVNNRALQLYTNGSSLVAEFELGGSTNSISVAGLSTATWYHAALVRYGTSIKLYLGGASGGTPITSSATWSDSGSPLRIGTFQDGSSGFNGNLAEIRFTKGIARYTADFTPPAASFPDA